MTYVVTQSCCADASCVVACPVNCIHPAPGEPGFATAEMLYVDADSCVGCGACATACPVDAIKPHTVLTPDEQPFLRINADYYDVLPARRPHAARGRARAAPARRDRARSGSRSSAPDRPGSTRPTSCSRTPRSRSTSTTGCPRRTAWCAPASRPTTSTPSRSSSCSARSRTSPASATSSASRSAATSRLADLEAQYDAVVYAVGAGADRALGIPGEDLAGSLSATDLVGWYNGHPDQQDLAVDLAHERAVVVGNGNVALDVARILTADPSLERTDIAALPWTALRRSAVREVVVLGRRGPAEAAFTVPELVGLAGLAERLDVVVDTGGRAADRRRQPARLRARSPRARRSRRRAIVLRLTRRCCDPRHHARRAIAGRPTEPTSTGVDGRSRDGADRGRSRPGSCCARSATAAARSPTCPTTTRPAPCPTTAAGCAPASTSRAGSSAARPASSAPTSPCAQETVERHPRRPRRRALPASRSARRLDRRRVAGRVPRGRRPGRLAGDRRRGAPPRRAGPSRAKIVDVEEMRRVAAGRRRDAAPPLRFGSQALAGSGVETEQPGDRRSDGRQARWEKHNEAAPPADPRRRPRGPRGEPSRATSSTSSRSPSGPG